MPAHVPIGVARSELWDDFYDCLDRCCARKRQNDILCIECDTNSRMGTSIGTIEYRSATGHFGIPHVNNSDQRFGSYLAAQNCVALTMCFRKKSYGTWTHPRSKFLHQIDYIITEKSEFARLCDAVLT